MPRSQARVAEALDCGLLAVRVEDWGIAGMLFRRDGPDMRAIVSGRPETGRLAVKQLRIQKASFSRDLILDFMKA